MLPPIDIQHRIKSFEVKEHSIPIHMPFAISKEKLEKAELVTVHITTDTWLTGLGECSPFPSLTYDTVPTSKKIALALLETIVGATPSQALLRIVKLKPDAAAQSITGYVGVEAALWDLYAKCTERSLAQVFGGAHWQKIRTDITLPLMEPHKVADFVRFFETHDFPIIKVKVGADLSQNAECLRELHKTSAKRRPLILDGNQALNKTQAKKIVHETQELGFEILFFEQPLPEKDLKSLAELAETLPIPICVDESVRTVQDLKLILEHQLKPIVNIKLMKSGLAESLEIIKLAQKAACPLMIGGMFESEIAMTFSLHLACGTGAITYFDLDTPYFFKDSLTKTHPWLQRDSTLYLPQGAGLGLIDRHG